MRSLFTAGALAVIRYAKLMAPIIGPLAHSIVGLATHKVAAIALANKLVRMAWAMMATDERYNEPAALSA